MMCDKNEPYSRYCICCGKPIYMHRFLCNQCDENFFIASAGAVDSSPRPRGQLLYIVVMSLIGIYIAAHVVAALIGRLGYGY